MLKQIENFCQQYNMLSGARRVLVCVSGGTDSMCLLHALSALSAKYGFAVLAAHYNHRLRGDESDGDEAFVREYCQKLGIPLFVGSGDVKGRASELCAGLEETARNMRYAFFFETAGRENIDRVATAHNADDDLETVLMRIVRGTGLRGLCGIPPVRGRLIRPLLGLTRIQIEAYNAENHVPHREDSTNLTDDYTRNRLRHAVVPVLRELNPSLTVTDMTALLRRDEEYLASLARSFMEEHAVTDALPVSELLSLPYPVSSRVIRSFAGPGLTSEHVQSVLDLAKSPDPSAKLSLPGLALYREYGAIKKGVPGRPTFSPFTPALDSPVIIEGTDLVVTVTECVIDRGIYNSLTTFYIKRDKIAGDLQIRPRLPGDALRLTGGRRTLKKLMIDRKIPRATREQLPVIADATGPLAAYLLGQNTDSVPVLGEPALKIKIEERRHDRE